MPTQIKNILIVYMSGFSRIVDELSSLLRKKGVKTHDIHRRNLTGNMITKTDLIITIGGDGTYLRASHFVFDSTPILGINPDPTRKEGFYTSINYNDILKKIDQIVNHDFNIIPLLRLKAYISGECIGDLALNEFYFGKATGYHMSKYEIKVKNKVEIQKSSGVLIGTPQGSHSWIGSAGGKKQEISDNKYQFYVREPYEGRLIKPTILKGFLNPDNDITLKALFPGFILVIDSLGEYRLKKDAQVRITCSNKPLNYVFF